MTISAPGATGASAVDTALAAAHDDLDRRAT